MHFCDVSREPFTLDDAGQQIETMHVKVYGRWYSLVMTRWPLDLGPAAGNKLGSGFVLGVAVYSTDVMNLQLQVDYSDALVIRERG